ncbi:MAG: fluoride efflux transporter CrcB [Actinobacteria bacterium HGW-Actinobacteria-4]|nr:MAG: fluoride efflux transporter CrcB [Actinobacteria bacterium HGW-Actinobacteria-4]
MNALVFIAVALAGGIGAASRLWLDARIRAVTSGNYPVGTMVINVAGSFLIGTAAGLGAARGLPESWLMVIEVGLFGGFTTFSTISVETIALVRERRHGTAVVVALGLLVVAVLAAAAGLWIGAHL